ncbi:MAG: hydantoinase/oxoprolinase family protein [Pirellulaceae bacterium]
MNWLGLDIGGANIKVADGQGFAASYPFALWRKSKSLEHELRKIISESPESDHLVATMTGELADCFETKQEGVVAILDAFERAADGRHVRVYLKDGALVAPPVARRRYTEAAASNWHALARFVGRYMELGTALLLDVGSTTCDVVLFRDGLPLHKGATDTQRLMSGEMVYTGVERSPLCAVAREVPYRDRMCPLAHEYFATTQDAYVILGDLSEDSANYYSADGRPATKVYARNRLARSICADADDFNHRDAIAISQAIAEAQAEHLASAIERVLSRTNDAPRSIVLSGHGEFLARRALEQLGIECVLISLRMQLGRTVARCSTAHALAVIAQEMAGA